MGVKNTESLAYFPQTTDYNPKATQPTALPLYDRMSPGDNNAVSWPSEGSSLVPRHPWILAVGPFTLQHKPGQCIAGLWARVGTDCCTCMCDLNWTSFLFQTHLPVTAMLPDHGSRAAGGRQRAIGYKLCIHPETAMYKYSIQNFFWV